MIYRNPAQNSLFPGSFCVGAVTGGQQTLPFWMSKISNEQFYGALEDSFSGSNIFEKACPKSDLIDWNLNAKIEILDPSLIGRKLKVGLFVLYHLNYHDHSVLEIEIASNGEGTFSDGSRMKTANERAAKNKIASLMEELKARKDYLRSVPKMFP